ncbi:MAG: hypothetical protein FJX76_11990, partial [Armatimonadetes bacterium]|nr:hypothetical protein [Armatimonadota bacterium]
MATTVQDAENLPFSRWAILAPLAVLLAFLWLTLMAFPHDDDVWFAWELRTRGLLGMLEAFYRELAGRFFANTVIVLPNMIADTLGLPLLSVYRATCALMLLATVATAYWAVGRLLETPPPTRAFLAGMLSCALIAGAPAPNDLYFWVSQ